MNIKTAFFIIIFFGFTLMTGCSSHPLLPEKKDIKVSRDNPSESCKNLGFIEGRTVKINGTAEEALEDLKSEAIRKGANYVQLKTMGALGTAIRGEAYFCD